MPVETLVGLAALDASLRETREITGNGSRVVRQSQVVGISGTGRESLPGLGFSNVGWVATRRFVNESDIHREIWVETPTETARNPEWNREVIPGLVPQFCGVRCADRGFRSSTPEDCPPSRPCNTLKSGSLLPLGKPHEIGSFSRTPKSSSRRETGQSGEEVCLRTLGATILFRKRSRARR